MGKELLTCISLCCALVTNYVHAAMDLTGSNVGVSLTTTNDGGQGFNVSSLSSTTATIDGNVEFTFWVNVSGFASKRLNLDFDSMGTIRLYADAQFGIGNTSYDDFSFDISVSFLDATVNSVLSGGNLVRGSASASGLDPIVWSFVNEQDNSFGKVMTYAGITGPLPFLEIDAAPVPIPAAGLLFISGIFAVPLFSRRRLNQRC